MYGIVSWFVSEADGSNKTTITYVPLTNDFMFQALPSITLEELRAVASAMADALSQSVTGYYAGQYVVPGGPTITFNIGSPTDPTDDTISVASVSATSWSRTKCQAFIDALNEYYPVP